MANDNRPQNINIPPKPGQPQGQQNGGQQGQQQAQQAKQPSPGEPLQQPPQKPLGTAEWVTDSEQFLINHGWTKAGYKANGQSIWNDPHTQDYGPCDPVVLHIPGKNKDGGEEVQVTKQTRGAPVPWIFELYTAIDIQRTRNKYAKEAGEFLTSKGWKSIGKNAYGRDLWLAPDEFDGKKMETIDAERFQKAHDQQQSEQQARIEWMRKKQQDRERMGAKPAVV